MGKDEGEKKVENNKKNTLINPNTEVFDHDSDY